MIQVLLIAVFGCCKATNGVWRSCYVKQLTVDSDSPHVGFPEGLAKSAFLGFPQVKHLFKTAAFLFGGSPRIKKRQDSESRERSCESTFHQAAPILTTILLKAGVLTPDFR